MYQIDDYVMCGESGVCKVVEIGTPPIGGVDKNRKYYFLKPIKGKTNVIYSPVDIEKKSLRYVTAKQEAERILDEIGNLEVFWEDSDNARKEVYKKSLGDYDCRNWMKTIKSVRHKKTELGQRGKKLHSVDQIYQTKLETLLFEELSFAMDMPKDELIKVVEEKID